MKLMNYVKQYVYQIKMDNSAEFYRFINTIILEALNKKKI